MWEWLWGMTLPWQGPVDTPPAVVETVACEPGFTYSGWEMVREERKFEGTWVVAYRHYTRTRTDICTDETVEQAKVEGPFQLWPAVPHQYVENVSRPTGGTEVSGTPLRSSDYPGGPGLVQVGPADGHTLGNGQRGPGSSGAPLNITAFILLAGALAFAATRRRYLSLLNGHEGAGNGFVVDETSHELLDGAQKFNELGYVADEGTADSEGSNLTAADHTGSGATDGEGFTTPQPILTLEGNSRDPGWAEGYPSGVTGGTHGYGSAGEGQAGAGIVASQHREDGTDPITTLEDNSRIAGDWVEMSNYPNDDSRAAGQDSLLMCKPVQMTPAQEWLANLRDRAHSTLNSLLELATDADLEQWRNFGQQGGGKRLLMVSDLVATVGTLGGYLLIKKIDRTETGHKVMNFISDLATGGTREDWARFGELGWKKQAWMIVNTTATVASIILPPLALSKAAPLLKGVPGLARVAIKSVAASRFGKFVGSVALRVSESWAGRAVAGAARWAGTKWAGSWVGQTSRAAFHMAKQGAVDWGANLMRSRVVQSVVKYSRAASQWVSETGLRGASDYLKLDPRNPLIKRLIEKMAKRFQTGHGLAQKAKAIFSGSRPVRWFANTKPGRLLSDSQLGVWHLREGLKKGNWSEHVLEGLENFYSRQLDRMGRRVGTGRVPAGSEKAKALQDVFRFLRGSTRGRREVETVRDWFAPKEQ